MNLRIDFFCSLVFVGKFVEKNGMCEFLTYILKTDCILNIKKDVLSVEDLVFAFTFLWSLNTELDASMVDHLNVSSLKVHTKLKPYIVFCKPCSSYMCKSTQVLMFH